MSVFVGAPTPPPSTQRAHYRFIQPPTLRGEVWVWPHLTVDRSEGRGEGVKATDDIERGLLVPYNGVPWLDDDYSCGGMHKNIHVSQREQDYALFSHLHDMNTDDAPRKTMNVWVVADPESHACANHFCIAGMVNEATEGKLEFYHSCFVHLSPDQLQLMPHYGAFTLGTDRFLLITSDVVAGSEILTYYGTSYKSFREGKYVAKQGQWINYANGSVDYETVNTLSAVEAIDVEEEADVPPALRVYKSIPEAIVDGVMHKLGITTEEELRAFERTSYMYGRAGETMNIDAVGKPIERMSDLRLRQTLWYHNAEGSDSPDLGYGWHKGFVYRVSKQPQLKLRLCIPRLSASWGDIELSRQRIGEMIEINGTRQHILQFAINRMGEVDGGAKP